jgi:hypothetical protein
MSPGDRMSKGLDFMLKGIGPKDKPSEAEGTLQESGLESQDKSVQLQDPSTLSPVSRVMTQELEVIAAEEIDVKHEANVRLQEAKVTVPESGLKRHESGHRLQDPRTVSQELRVMTPESGVESRDKSVRLQDPSILSQEPGVTTPESGISALEEKDVRLESSIGLPESRVMTQESAAQLQETRPRSQEEMKTSRNETQESGVVTDDIIGQAVAQALKSPKISLYSPLLLAVLESQQLMLLNRL